MRILRILYGVIGAAIVTAAAMPALAADDILDAIDEARKAYQSGDLANAKQSLDLASQLIGQKNAEGFATLLPEPLAGWKADKAQTSAVGASMFGAFGREPHLHQRQGRRHRGPDHRRFRDDRAVCAAAGQSAIAGAMGKIIRVGNQRAIQSQEGDIIMVIANKFLVVVQGSAGATAKMAYAQAVDVAKLSKM